MNILSLVFAALLILGLFAHTQWNNFKNFTIVKDQYIKYIVHSEREHFNKRQTMLFETRKKKPSSDDADQRNKVNARPKINIKIILEKKLREKSPLESEQHLYITKELIKVIFSEVDFYKKIAEHRPDFLDEMFVRLMKESTKQKFKDIQSLTTLDLHDDELQNVYYKILNGIPKTQLSNTHGELIEIGEGEFIPDETIVSLKEFFHFQTHKKISVYTASQYLLEAIFDLPTAKQIILLREQLYKEIKKADKSAVDMATEKLKAFLPKKKPEIKEEILSFEVTKTNPTSYR